MRISRRRYKPQPPKLRIHFNEGIRVPELRLLDENGEHLGVMTTEKAIALARERGLDLVEINPIAQPPVAKITEYGQYKYQMEKEERQKRAHAKETEIKGVRLSLRIGNHDLELRKNQALKFFKEGHKVRVEIILRGRERAYTQNAIGIINDFTKTLRAELPVFVEQPVSKQMNKIIILLAARGATGGAGGTAGTSGQEDDGEDEE